jgi:hypothetical protein
MREEMIGRLLVGAIDLHCHSGPSVMPRRLNHVEAIRQAEAAGLRAILFKDHYYSVSPVAELLKETLSPKVELLTGVPLNNTVGGLNPYAVEHADVLCGQPHSSFASQELSGHQGSHAQAQGAHGGERHRAAAR